MSDVFNRMTDLSPQKRELLTRLLRERGFDLSRLPIIPRAGDRSTADLSFAQQRLWFLSQLEPGNPFYNVPTVVRFNGLLDTAAFQRALNTIVQRHEALRTVFPIVDGRPLQVIIPTLTVSLPIVDIPGTDADTIRQLAGAEIQQPFDLGQGPLLRAMLLRLSDADHVLVLTMHHIVSDGWSMNIFIRELATLYDAFIAGRLPTLAALPIQYADYAVWQRQWLQGEVLESQLAYWREQLADLPTLNLPTDHARPPIQTFRGARQPLVLRQALSADLAALAQSEGATMFMLLLAAFQTLLARYSGQRAIVVGSPIAGRHQLEIEGLIGCFINMLVLRTDLSGNPTFRELLARVRQMCMEAYAHQDLPFEKLVEELQPTRDLSRQPLFQALFILQDDPLAAQQLPQLTLDPLVIDNGTAQFDLTLSMIDSAEGLVSMLEYNSDLLESETIARMAGHLQTLLAGIVADPSRHLSELPLLTLPEQQQQLVIWQGPRVDYPADLCLHTLIERQVARTPDAVAVVFDFRGKETGRHGDKDLTRDQGSGIRNQDSRLPAPDPRPLTPDPCCLTYAELNGRANQLAQHLRSLGVGPEVRVGICLERSLELVVGLLGILKAGGTYVPLDPDYPPARLAFMLEDSRAQVLITTMDDGRWTMDDDLQSDTDIVYRLSSIVYLDADWPIVARQPETNPDSGAAPEHPAYVIYTSGSTGQPKGAMNSHGAIVNRLLWMQDTYGLTPRDHVLQKTSFSFDVSVWEFFWPLLSGARLVVAQPQGHKDPAYLSNLIAAQQISTLHFVPSMLRLFLEQPGLDACRSLRRVICSGEALPAEVQERFFARLDAELHNLYGPTEAAVDVTSWACERDNSLNSVPIGRPIANTQIYILDSDMQPVPVGVPGELHIGGANLARGYLNRADLTAERFVPNPWGSGVRDQGSGVTDRASDTRYPTPNTRLYKTGDLARYRPDGVIEFLGRRDQQIKIRGFRVEPGEIQATLCQHPLVRAAAVVGRGAVGDKRLVAYVVPHQGSGVRDQGSGVETTRRVVSTPDPRSLIPQLRTFLQTRLPDYMVPSVFMMLDALPLNPNGKLDLRALPDPDGARTAPEATYVAPRTDVEQQIAAIWQAVLGIDRVGVDDNFFDLGGHSLLLIQVHSQLCELLNQSLSVVELFQYPTISALVRHICQEQPEQPTPQQAQQRADTRLDTMHQQRQFRRHSSFARRSDHANEDQGMDTADTFSSEIAIIGMSGRFPGASSVEAFWQNISAGVESIAHFSDHELLAAGVRPTLLNHPAYVRAHGALEDIDRFDAHFFGYLPHEAEMMDPQQRLFLECAWEALERAGYDSALFDGQIGLYAGSSMSSYMFILYANQELLETMGSFQALIGNDKDFLATRVAYKLNLRGPAMSVQTACSTSLVAVHLACQSLLNGECDMALAGGVSIGIHQRSGYVYHEAGILSPDGHCRAFDAGAQGTVGGSGVGVVVLKRLADALADGDQIHAVIKGFAINNDGSQKVGYTAPSVDGQAEVIREALALARVEPESIGYIEAHGTATPLGDPIEVTALNRVFRRSTDKTSFCALGSVKTNIGHLDAAAGVAGLIKTVMALKHQQIPPSLHFERPNPQIDFANTPFYVSTHLSEWPCAGTPRRAGVSSFGIGGTNAHIVLEEAPQPVQSGVSQPWQVLPLSAKTSTALAAATTNLAAYLREHAEVPLADVAYTLQVGRRTFEHRQIVVCRGVDDATAALDTPGAGRVFRAVTASRERPVVFMFPGQGAQYLRMAQGIYAAEPVFRAHMDHCADLFAPHLGLDIREVLYPAERDKETRRQGDTETTNLLVSVSPGLAADALLDATWLTQPALFAVEYALAQLWMSWGVQPQALIGHSLGEYVAACLAGVFSLEDATTLVAARGRLMQQVAGGAMLSIPLAADVLQPLLGDRLSLAAINGPALCVAAGPTDLLEQLELQLGARGLTCRRLSTAYAFHSPLIDPILDDFAEQVRKIDLRAPNIPFLSNVTGTWATQADVTNPFYWARQLRQTVRFADGVATLLQDANRVLLEVGPGRTLISLARSQSEGLPALTLLSSLRHPQEQEPDEAFLLTTLGRLWMAGATVNWAGLHDHELRLRVQLPTYPFERQRYWLDPRTPTPDERSPEPNAVLPTTSYARPDLPNEYVAPRSELEQKIALIWQDCLRIAPIGVHDNFFELGGHSLIATDLIFQIRDLFPIDLPLHSLFAAPTVAGLAELLEAKLIEKIATLSDEEIRLFM